MENVRTKLTSQGPVSVPAAVRSFLHVMPGSTLVWSQDGDRIVVERAKRPSTAEVHQALFGGGGGGHRRLPHRPSVWLSSSRVCGSACSGAMEALDTNVLVRLLARDDVKQAVAADAAVAKGAWVSQLVLEVARKAGHLPLATFDKSLGRLAGAQRLWLRCAAFSFAPSSLHPPRVHQPLDLAHLIGQERVQLVRPPGHGLEAEFQRPGLHVG